jgi:two-component system phosphate regulon sensor histidine kinase PhoR
MATTSLQVITLRISFVISALTSTVFFFSIDREPPFNFLITALFFIGVFVIAFFSFRYTIDRIILEKLSTIYKTIHELKRSKVDTDQKLNADEAIAQVQDEVTDWFLDNKKELDRLTILEKYRRDFIGNVSHELKTPVFNIQGYLLTLLEGGLEDKNINRKYLEGAEKSVEKLIKLLSELDMIIRLDTGSIELDVRRIDIVNLVRETIESLILKAEKKNIKFKINQKNNVPIWVMADGDKIMQVLTNLLSNSIKYGIENGQTDIRFHDMKNKVLIEVKDNGIGIKKESLSRVFDRFYRTDAARSVDRKGTGLGLSIAKHIVEAHKETIHVNSEDGAGSTFSFTLKKA